MGPNRHSSQHGQALSRDLNPLFTKDSGGVIGHDRIICPHLEFVNKWTEPNSSAGPTPGNSGFVVHGGLLNRLQQSLEVLTPGQFSPAEQLSGHRSEVHSASRGRRPSRSDSSQGVPAISGNLRSRAGIGSPATSS